MEGIKLINASEVVTSKKTSKIEIKKIPKSPMKIITDDNQKNTVDSASIDGAIARPDILKSDTVAKSDTITRPNIVKPDDVSTTGIAKETNFGNRTIRGIKLKEEVYYGPKNANKNKFVRLYKKFGLKWTTYVPLNGMIVDGWFNEDKSQYIIKLLEDGDFKRFKFYGCDEIYNYFVDLGGKTFDHNKEDSLSSNYINNNANNAMIIGKNPIVATGSNVNNAGSVSSVGSVKSLKDTDEDYKFIGADLWSGYRTKQLLKGVPDNWGVVWK